MKKFKKIYIAGINRSGGSLLARLFDNHSKILSYPIELGFPRDLSYFDIVEDYSGVPQSVPIYNPSTDIDIFDLLELPKKKPSYETTWGKEHADPLGVRKNYLEKVFYGNIKTDFDYDLFKEIVSYESKKASNIVDLYNIRHYAYFKSWDNAKYLKNQSHIVMHDSGGLYLTNIDYYFDSFKDSTLIYPLRDIYGYIAAEKTRFARRYFGSRRFAWPQCPNLFVKKFTSYEIGKNILLINSEAVFRRSLSYRIFPIETFFRWRPNIELNFTLAPIWGRARIEMDTTPGDKTDDWNYFITSFGGSANPVSDMGATDAMVSDWIGYSSLLGFRYYVNTRLGVDVKAGFMNNQYKASEWRIQRQKVTGPELKIDDLPIFSIKIIYGLR